MAMRNAKMRPYGGSATRKLPTPPRSDGKPGGDDELGHSNDGGSGRSARPSEPMGSWEDGSARWEQDGHVFVRDDEGNVTSEGEFKQKKRKRQFEDETPPHRKKKGSQAGQGGTIVVA